MFDLDAGRLCLDFVNTRPGHRSAEHLPGYAALLAFAEQSGVLTPEEASELQARADEQPDQAEAVLQQARRLRAALAGVFGAVAADDGLPAHDLDVVNAALAEVLGHARLVAVDGDDGDGAACGWGWETRLTASLDGLLRPILRSAVDLLTSAEVRSVRECGASDCAWLFMDSSKNRSRQWCSMQSCGNREKARRHYQRVRASRARR